MPPCHGGDRRFKSVQGRQFNLIFFASKASEFAGRQAAGKKCSDARRIEPVAETYYRYAEQRSTDSNDADGRLSTNAHASVAQSVEQRTENPRVGSSILP